MMADRVREADGAPEQPASPPSELAREAALLKFGLLNGFTNVAEAVAWADARIEADAQPHSALLEVSTRELRGPAEVAAELDPLAGLCSHQDIIDDILGLMYRALSRDCGLAMRIASTLYRFAIDDVVPAGADCAPMFYFEDALDLIRCNYGDRPEAEVIVELLDFLRPFSTTAAM